MAARLSQGDVLKDSKEGGGAEAMDVTAADADAKNGAVDKSSAGATATASDMRMNTQSVRTDKKRGDDSKSKDSTEDSKGAGGLETIGAVDDGTGDRSEGRARDEMESGADDAAEPDAADVNVGAQSKKRRLSTEEASNETLAAASASAGAAVREEPVAMEDGEGVRPVPISTTTLTAESSAAKAGGAESASSLVSAESDSAVIKIGGGVVQFGGVGEAVLTAMDVSAEHSEASSRVGNADGDADLDRPALGSGQNVGVAAVMTMAYQAVLAAMAVANNSNSIREENYYLLHWLYRIRRVSCARGIRAGFLQPDFLWSIYRPMMRSTICLRRTNDDIYEAVAFWCSDRAAAEERYGHISDWDVSSVTDMSRLFRDFTDFNEKIGRWDVSKVTNMKSMFSKAHSFNQAVGDWNISEVTNMSYMFSGAQVFNQAIGEWNVLNVNDMSCMFSGAQVFNQAIGEWNVSNVTDMKGMFQNAHSFNQAIGNWDVSSVTDVGLMFNDAQVFNQALGNWKVSKVTKMEGMFADAHEFNQVVGNGMCPMLPTRVSCSLARKYSIKL